MGLSGRWGLVTTMAIGLAPIDSTTLLPKVIAACGERLLMRASGNLQVKRRPGEAAAGRMRRWRPRIPRQPREPNAAAPTVRTAQTGRRNARPWCAPGATELQRHAGARARGE